MASAAPKPSSILFVCLGNICRSPAGQAILEQQAKERGLKLKIASCGLGDWHTGQRPDARMRKAAQKRGLELRSIARELRPQDFETSDLILAADEAVLKEVKKRSKGKKLRGEIALITHYSNAFHQQEVPDPYHGRASDFDHVLDMLEEACSCLLDHIEHQ